MNQVINKWKSSVQMHNSKIKDLRQSSRDGIKSRSQSAQRRFQLSGRSTSKDNMLQSTIRLNNQHSKTLANRHHEDDEGNRTPPQFNRDLQEVLSSTNSGFQSSMRAPNFNNNLRTAALHQDQQAHLSDLEYGDDDDGIQSSDQKHTLNVVVANKHVPKPVHSPAKNKLRRPFSGSKQKENHMANNEEISPMEVVVGKFQKLIAEKNNPKGKTRAKIKQILGSFHQDLQNQRSEFQIQIKRLRQEKENSKNRNQTTTKLMSDLEGKLFDCEREKLEMRKDRDRLNKRIGELQKQRETYIINREMFQILKQGQKTLEVTNHSLNQALQQQKKMFQQERYVWTAQLNQLQQKLEHFKYGSGIVQSSKRSVRNIDMQNSISSNASPKMSTKNSANLSTAGLPGGGATAGFMNNASSSSFTKQQRQYMKKSYKQTNSRITEDEDVKRRFEQPDNLGIGQNKQSFGVIMRDNGKIYNNNNNSEKMIQSPYLNKSPTDQDDDDDDDDDEVVDDEDDEYENRSNRRFQSQMMMMNQNIKSGSGILQGYSGGEEGEFLSNLKETPIKIN